MHKTALLIGASLVAAACAPMVSGPQAIDWSKVPATKVALFYPGQSSYEWLRSDAHKGAAKETQRGDSCVSCHDDPKEEQMQGAKILKGNHPLEPEVAALKGKPGHVDVTVQAAFDEKNTYLRFQWQATQPGTEHPYYRFDGKEWKKYGETIWHDSVKSGKQPALYESRFSVMLDDGKVPGFDKQGCWQSCHTGMNDMQNEATKEEVAANPLLKAIKKTDLRKYLPETRTNPSDWKTGKSLEEIAKLKEAGGFVDLFQWRGARSHSAGMADDGYVLEYRNSDAGKNMWAGNFDSKSKQPKFMWDEKKAGYKAITADRLHKAEHYLDPISNAVPFDPKAGWKEGDLLPGNTVSRSHAEGSAADNNSIASYKDGKWTLVMIRPLGLANKDDKALKAGAVYNVGFAVHDGNTESRAHYVSYNKTLGLAAQADIVATRLP
jgi:hypothetical protein